MAFNTPKIPEKIKVAYTIERVKQYVLYPLRCYKCQKYGHHKINCWGQKCMGNMVNKDLITTLMSVNFPLNVPTVVVTQMVYARSCDTWRREKEILAIKHRSNLPYETQKIVIGFKTTAYSQAVQWGKTLHNKYEQVVKTLIQLELSN